MDRLGHILKEESENSMQVLDMSSKHLKNCKGSRRKKLIEWEMEGKKKKERKRKEKTGRRFKRVERVFLTLLWGEGKGQEEECLYRQIF